MRTSGHPFIHAATHPYNHSSIHSSIHPSIHPSINIWIVCACDYMCIPYIFCAHVHIHCVCMFSCVMCIVWMCSFVHVHLNCVCTVCAHVHVHCVYTCSCALCVHMITLSLTVTPTTTMSMPTPMYAIYLPTYPRFEQSYNHTIMCCITHPTITQSCVASHTHNHTIM